MDWISARVMETKFLPTQPLNISIAFLFHCGTKILQMCSTLVYPEKLGP
jgi:hypothetical protein